MDAVLSAIAELTFAFITCHFLTILHANCRTNACTMYTVVSRSIQAIRNAWIFYTTSLSDISWNNVELRDSSSQIFSYSFIFISTTKQTNLCHKHSYMSQSSWYICHMHKCPVHIHRCPQCSECPDNLYLHNHIRIHSRDPYNVHRSGTLHWCNHRCPLSMSLLQSVNIHFLTYIYVKLNWKC